MFSNILILKKQTNVNTIKPDDAGKIVIRD